MVTMGVIPLKKNRLLKSKTEQQIDIAAAEKEKAYEQYQKYDGNRGTVLEKPLDYFKFNKLKEAYNQRASFNVLYK